MADGQVYPTGAAPLDIAVSELAAETARPDQAAGKEWTDARAIAERWLRKRPAVTPSPGWGYDRTARDGSSPPSTRREGLTPGSPAHGASDDSGPRPHQAVGTTAQRETAAAHRA
jgi:hypothetical protein